MKAKALLVATTMAGSLFFPPSLATPAVALTESNYSNFYQQSTSQNNVIVSFLKENGVTEKKQKELMERLDRGEVWDSMKGIEPISEIQTADGKITSTYPDGSVAVFSINNGFENSLQGFSMTPQEVSECNYIGGHYASYWKNCKATWSYGLATYTLRFNYTYDQGGWRIMDYWEPLYRTYN